MVYNRDAEIAEQNLVFAPQEQILRFDVAMDKPLLMRVVQRRGYLLHISDDDGWWDRHALGMALAKRAVGGIIHYQVRNGIFNPIV